LDRRLGGPIAVLDAVVKKKIPSLRRESKLRTPIVQPVAQLYNDRAITALTFRFGTDENVGLNSRFFKTISGDTRFLRS
jgi:hypothetical protein